MNDAAHPADMADHELIRALQNGSLDAASRERALRELDRRGIALPPPASGRAMTPAQESVPANGHFAGNPYQTPQAASLEPLPEAGAPTRAQRIRNMLWWTYIGVIVLIVLRIGSLLALGYLANSRIGMLAVAGAWALGVLGLVRWRLGRPPRWRFFLGLLAIVLWGWSLLMTLIALAGVALWLAGSPQGFLNGPWSVLGVLALMLLPLPMAWGISSQLARSQSAR